MAQIDGGGGGGTDAVIALRGGLVIGHAMATDGTGPRGARMTEIGVVVADAWQGRGVGSALVRALISGAQERGVTAVAMDVLPANRRVLAMITRHWPAARISRSPDCLTVWLRLPHHQQPRGLPGLAARPHMSDDRLGQAMASCQERQGSGGAGSLPA